MIIIVDILFLCLVCLLSADTIDCKINTSTQVVN